MFGNTFAAAHDSGVLISSALLYIIGRKSIRYNRKGEITKTDCLHPACRASADGLYAGRKADRNSGTADGATGSSRNGRTDRCYVTPVREQNPFGTCWGFASIAAAEISILGSVLKDDQDAWKTLDL